MKVNKKNYNLKVNDSNQIEEFKIITKISDALIDSTWFSEYKKSVKVFEPLINASNEINEKLNPVRDTLKLIIDTLTPTLKAIEKERDNPHSRLSWYEYTLSLSKYYWVYPYGITEDELRRITREDINEEKFDSYMEKHFSISVLEELQKETNCRLPQRHKVLYSQCMIALQNDCYELCNLGFISIIDDLTSYYLKDKGCIRRYDMFKPIVDAFDEMDLEDFKSQHFLLMMVHHNINTLYENINFNFNISINLHKDLNRHTSMHGKYYSNQKASSLMLANTIYFLLILNEKFHDYKDTIVKNKKGFGFIDGFDSKVIIKIN